jgi:hypothetical protein
LILKFFWQMASRSGANGEMLQGHNHAG